MKNIFIYSILVSMIFSYNTGYSGMYFNDGFTVSGNYANQIEDRDKSNAIGIGFSYLAYQEKTNSPVEISGFYNRINTEMEELEGMDLNMEMISAGLTYYIKKIKFGYHYETLSNYSGDVVDFLNDMSDNTLEISSSSKIFSIGFYSDSFKRPNSDLTLFLDLMRLNYELFMSAELPYVNFEIEKDSSTNLLRCGAGFKMKNLVIQPMITMNEDEEKRYSLTAIYKINN